jgi:uncharacterized protein
MPKRETAPIGAPCWVDLMTPDPASAVEFYTRLLGWTAEEPNEAFGGYINFQKDGVRVAGCIGSQPEQGPGVWAVYLASDDAKKTVDAAAANGGEVVSPAMDVGDLGTMAILTDSSGAGIGVWQPGTHPGFKEYAESGAPGWFELHTRDYAAAVDFYRTVFGWETQPVSDTDEFRYTIMKNGDEMLGGILDASSLLPDGVPSHWSVYFGADDADVAAAKIRELGGKILREPEDTPYGKLATAADPSGVQFKIVAPNEAMPARS